MCIAEALRVLRLHGNRLRIIVLGTDYQRDGKTRRRLDDIQNRYSNFMSKKNFLLALGAGRRTRAEAAYRRASGPAL